MHIKTIPFARSAALLCAFALLSCTASSDEAGRAEAVSTAQDAGADGSTSLFAGGAGTEASPYQVATCAQLQALETALFSFFVLTADIDCTGFDAGDGGGFRPIGTDSLEFGGRVNGQGHVITGLRIARPSENRVGLFGRTRWAVLRNFGLVSPNVEGQDDVGAVTGWQRWGLVEQVSVRGATVTGRNRVGALVGHMHHSKVYNSYARAELTCTMWDGFSGGGQSLWNRDCGQLVGTSVHGIVLNSYAAVVAAPHFGIAGGSSPRTHTAAFYDCDIVAGCAAPHEERRTTSQLQSEAYLVAQLWDFLAVWDIAAPGTYPCLQWEPSCGEPSCAPSDATCDGVDDDCSGTADEDFAPTVTACGVGACGATGATSCVSGAVVDTCEAGTPASADATCDGLDDDCDGTVDEDFAPTDTACGVGACGATGATSCVSGAVVDSCEAGTPASTDATCDGLDDDCDGTADEDFAPAATSCGVGACGATGATSCVSGAEVDSCEAGIPAGADATCDGVDDDCNGTADEDFAPAATSCGVGACGATGATSCVSGAVVDSCQAGSPVGLDVTCDGLDDDCDASTDEAYAPAATSCGVGACGATGATSCVSGAVVDSCEAGIPAGADATCDGVDDDCNGTADEDFAPAATSCGVGACGATGATSCVSGAVVDSCEAGIPASADVTCDGVDDDCDASTDEAYAPVATSCGVGACGATGATSCVSGAVVDSCEAGTPASTDTDCDRVDDDCDGQTDEAYASTPTECGVGACTATGSLSCVFGRVVDSCHAGAPSDDANCDNVDQDCDGAADDDYQPTETTCGSGTCASTGVMTCQSGVEVDSCRVGLAWPNDVCDGLDEDCDGTVDEGFVSVATSCGFGVCAAMGATSCVSGTIVSSCAPGAATGDDSDCDGMDDDCDGGNDEGFATRCASDEVESCVAGAMVRDACSDQNACNGEETCLLGACIPGQAQLDDGDVCTIDLCDPVTGIRHEQAPAGFSCSDGNPCNGEEQCGPTVPELLRNPSFETFITPNTRQGAIPAEWLVSFPSPDTYSNDGSFGLTPSSFGNFTGVTAHDGIRWIAGWSAEPEEFGQTLSEPLEPGVRYRVSAYLRRSSRSDLGGLGTYAVYLATGTLPNGRPARTGVQVGAFPPLAASPAGTWQFRSFEFIAPADAAQRRLITFSPAVGSDLASTYPGLDLASLTRVTPFPWGCLSAGPIAVSDGNPCTADSCDPETGVAHVPVAADTPCADTNFCNGEEVCDGAGQCRVGVALDVSDGLVCTTDSCDPVVGIRHLPMPTGTTCGSNGTCDSTGFCSSDENQWPVFVSAPLTTLSLVSSAPASDYEYTAVASDLDGDTLTYQLVASPIGMTIDAITGRVRWHVDSSRVGAHVVTIRANDGFGGVADQSFALEVTLANGTPRILSAPLSYGRSGIPYLYRVLADDPDGDPIAIQLLRGPAGMTVDASGLISWPLPNVGTELVVVSVSDPSGRTVRQSYSLVITMPSAPQWTSTPLPYARDGWTYAYASHAIDRDPGDVVHYGLLAGPVGLGIDPVSGLVTWVPAASQRGVHAVTLGATDNDGLISVQSFDVLVSGENQPPVFTSVPRPTLISPGVEWLYPVETLDPDGDDVAVSLVSPLAGASIGSGNVLRFTPTAADIGDHLVSLVADDGRGGMNTQRFRLTVSDAIAPRFVTVPPILATQDTPYAYDAVAVDANPGDIVRYRLTTAPAGMTIKPSSGRVRWTPSPSQVGSHTVTIVAYDNANHTAVQRWVITVQSEEDATPSVTLTATPDRLEVGETTILHVDALDIQAYTIQSIEVDGTPLSVGLNGEASYVGLTPGVLTAAATVVDTNGNVRVATTLIRVLDASDDEPPTVSLTSPEDSEELTYLHDVVGSVLDDNLYRWRVSVRFMGEADEQVVLEGAGEVNHDVLGQLDTTQLINGLYTLRLYAEDVNGQWADVTRPVRVSGDAKLGVVRFSVTDVAMPTHDVPITVTRHYDSTDPRRGDFGYGWRLEESESSVQVSRPLGEGIAIWSRTGPFVFPCTDVFEQQQHSVEVRLSDDEYYTFGVEVSNLAAISGRCSGDVFMEQVAGTVGGAELLPLGNTMVFGVNFRDVSNPVNLPPASLQDAFTLEVWNATQFELQLPDGRKYRVDTERGTTALIGRNGLSVVYNATGMIHSGGRSVTYVRDTQGRIVQVRDQDGRSVEYAYDAAGDLVAVADQLGRVTTYEYDPQHAHHLVAITDYRGVRVLSAEYQDDGRISESCDADSICEGYEYDLPGRRGVTRNTDGAEVALSYDLKGRINARTDALGNTWNYQHSPSGALLAETDPTGARRTYEYDGQGRRVASTTWHGASDDPADFRTSWTYDGSSTRIDTLTLRRGGVVDLDYDANGNQTAMSDGDGNVIWSATYDATGRKTSETDRSGTETFEYASSSQREPSRVIGVDGQVEDLTYDAAGNLTEVLIDGERWGMAYDPLNRVTTQTFPDGGVQVFEYPASSDVWDVARDGAYETRRLTTMGGRLAGWVNEGRTDVAVDYNQLGLPAAIRDASGTSGIETLYDAGGRVLSQTDIASGTSTAYVRDGAGRVLETTDAAGHVHRNTYDGAGRLSTATNPLGHAWSYGHERLASSMTDPLSRTTRTEVNGYGQVTRMVFADGTTSSVSYLGSSSLDEAGELPVLVVDEAGREREFGYTDLELTSATDSAGNTWTYTPSGLVATVTSPEGRSRTIISDDAGRALRREYSDGAWYESVYSGPNFTSRTDITGTTVTMGYDAEGRETERSTNTGELRTLTYDTNGDIESVTTQDTEVSYSRNALGQLSQVDADAGAVSYTYDVLGRILTMTVAPTAGTPTQTTREYDAAGNVVAIVDSALGRTEYAYDAANQRTRRTLPNGVVTSYTYDLRGRIASITHRAPGGTVLMSRAYTRASSGEPTRVTHEDGSYVEYGYDAALRLTSEQRFSAGGTLVSETAYTYDRDGNRLTVVRDGATDVYAYGTGERLVSVTRDGSPHAAYTHDALGRTSTQTVGGATAGVTYDSLDRAVTISGARPGTYQYDGEGRRVRLSDAAGATVEHLVVDSPDADVDTPLVAVIDGAVVARYLHGTEGPLARVDDVGAPRFYLEDGLGSIIGHADQDGDLLGEIEYDAFGSVLSGDLSDDLGGDYGFQGMWRDPTGLYYVHARMYDPALGRFLTRDLAEGDPANVESWISYAFAANNPNVFADPTGLFTISSQMAASNVRQVLTQVARSGLAQKVRYQIKQEIQEAVGELILDAVFAAITSAIPGIDSIAPVATAASAGQLLESVFESAICQVVPSSGAGWVRLEVPIGNSGRPATNGFGCGEEPPSTNGSGGGPRSGSRRRGADFGRHSFPDFMLTAHPPSQLDEDADGLRKSFFAGDIKLRPRSINTRSAQFDRLVAHGSNYSYAPVIAYVTLFEFSAFERRRIIMDAEAEGQSHGRPVFPALFSIRGN